ncbi:hypothetical protein [Occallatibacter riparius]|uniref:Uncharacterized protein n=1 Tax=Occallatibacter riparius TaxID=1002689 RepID=A0A9J7BI69_9BACT|nr:hypothetical protein [Occallatibacter riparius]UWZ82407.1 hypothetical protein MOP44_17735 [Occallatibacter riparius]
MLSAKSETVFADSAEWMQDDPRWRVAQQVAGGPHFARSPLLSRFLLYVVSETLEGRHAAITEHKIGVAVFGRPVSYRTDDDNIVRNYARQLRKRLAEHFAREGKDSPIRIEIPVGGYVPSFPEVDIAPQIEQPDVAHEVIPASGIALGPLHRRPSISRKLAWPLAALIIILAGFVVWFTGGGHTDPRSTTIDHAHALWRAEMPSNGITYVVPTDAGFNLMEDMAHRSLSLADYIKGQYADMPPQSIDAHTRQDLGTQPYTDFVSLQVVSMLARRPEYDPKRVLLRFPRDLRVDDLKKSSAVIIGSADSNPWASLVDANANFRIVPQPEMSGAAIMNMHPEGGEQKTYRSHWGEPAHETFALILLQPNLSGSGYLLLIEGLDIAGTQAAAELLFSQPGIAPIVERALRKDGSLRPFEVLVRATSIQSNAAGTEIVASRIH